MGAIPCPRHFRVNFGRIGNGMLKNVVCRLHGLTDIMQHLRGLRIRMFARSVEKDTHSFRAEYVLKSIDAREKKKKKLLGIRRTKKQTAPLKLDTHAVRQTSYRTQSKQRLLTRSEDKRATVYFEVLQSKLENIDLHKIILIFHSVL